MAIADPTLADFAVEWARYQDLLIGAHAGESHQDDQVLDRVPRVIDLELKARARVEHGL